MLPKINLEYPFSSEEAIELLEFLSAHPQILPWGFNPMAVYLFLSLGCFTANSETWLVPGLRELGYPVSPVDSHRTILSSCRSL